jgi:hypothetical protein
VETGTTYPTTSTTTSPLTTSTTSSPATTTQPNLGEPFEDDDLPTELSFLKDMGIGLGSLTTGIIGGIALLVFALSMATIILLVGKKASG